MTDAKPSATQHTGAKLPHKKYPH